MSTKGKKLHRRNPQRKVLMEKLAETGSLTKAAKVAGYSSVQSASNALRSLSARGELIDELVAQGWSPREYVKKHLLPMLGRKKTIYFQNQGIVTDKRIVEDTEAQLVAGDRYLKIIGGYAKSSDDVRAESDVEVKVILERIGSDAPPRIIEIKPDGPATDGQEQPQISGSDFHPPRDDAIDVQPVAPTEEPDGSVEAVLKQPNPVVPSTNQVVPPTVPTPPKTRVAGFVCLGRPRRFWNPGRT